jgi:hypothetical protein
MAESIHLYLDEDTSNRALIKALRARGIDVLTAKEANLIQAPDERHLEYAASLSCTVFTFNARDFARLHTDYLSTNRHHAGIIISAQLPVGIILRRLLKLLHTRSVSEMRDWLEYLSE